MSTVLIRMLGANSAAALAMYNAIRTQSLQADVLNAAAKVTLEPDQLDIFKAVIAVTESTRTPRNHLAHWLWATSPDVPDALLLVDPRSRKLSVIEQVRFLDGLVSAEDTADGLSKRILGFDASRVLVYTEGDLLRASMALLETALILMQYRIVLKPLYPEDREAEGTAAQALQQLLGTKRFREALDRVRKDRSRNRSPPQSE